MSDSDNTQDAAAMSPASAGYAEQKDNTARELWRGGDHYSDSIHVTESGGIGIQVGGRVLVMPLRRWYDVGAKLFSANGGVPKWRRWIAMWLLGLT